MKSLVAILYLASGLTLLHADTLAPGTVYNIVFIGDSITMGAGVPNRDQQAAPVIATHELEQMLGGGASVYFSNQGQNGHTTTDFLPAGSDFAGAEKAASQLMDAHKGQLVFSIMLGTNDSANKGPTGAPLPADSYAKNLHAIIDTLLAQFPDAKFVLNHPIWYSPNTHNGADYEGSSAADRLKSYFGAIDSLVADFAKLNPGHVFLGDTDAYNYFSIHFQTELKGENGTNGTFYLHPNPTGAQTLGKFWATAIAKDIK